MSWQTDNQVGRAPQVRGRRGSALPAPDAPQVAPAAVPAAAPPRTFGGAAGPVSGGVYAPEMATAPAVQAVPDTGELITKDQENQDGGVVGGNIEAANAAPAEAPASPATPAPGIIRSSLGGSMARFQNPNGVEEIRGTGRPSWQLYQGAGQTDAYPAAVQNWHSGLVKESAEAAKAKLAADTQLEVAKTPAREAPGQAEERRQKSYVFEEAKKKAEEENRINKRNTDVKEYKNQLINTPYATFKPGTGHVWEPQSPELDLDAKAGENLAGEYGWKAGLDHLHERQTVRKYLGSQASYPQGTNMNAVINDLAASPEAWKKLVGVAKQAGTTSAPPVNPGFVNNLFQARPQGAVDRNRLQDLTSSME